MVNFSDEQQRIIDAPIKPCSVIACAGSGKTLTAVSRLHSLRRRLSNDRTHIALLSFTNVAIETFKNKYKELVSQENNVFLNRVEISTLDSFFAQNILLPHGHLIMGCKRRPFLVNGNEKFLKEFTSRIRKGGDYLVKIRIEKMGQYYAFVDEHGKQLNIQPVLKIIKDLGIIGAYTHEFGRLWVFRLLEKYPRFLKAFAHRYRHIIIDEAQDISLLQLEILSLLEKEGVQISLIGDPMQAIFEFNGADGQYLKSYSSKQGVSPFVLNQNFRSTSLIQNAANFLSGRSDKGMSEKDDATSALLITTYKNSNISETAQNFQSYIKVHYPDIETLRCLTRNNSSRSNSSPKIDGIMPTKLFAKAALLRDISNDLVNSYEFARSGFFYLICPESQNYRQFWDSLSEAKQKAFHRMIWDFVRNPDSGLPSVKTNDTNSWHCKLKTNLKKFLNQLLLNVISTEQLNEILSSLGHSVVRTKLDITKLVENANQINQPFSLVINTVHSVKGDEFDAVLYFLKKKQLDAWHKQTDSEEGRINYVALTRAKKLFCAAVPEEHFEEYSKKFFDLGFKYVYFDNKESMDLVL